MLVKVIPKSQRAVNRINEHGQVFDLVKLNNDKFLVESLNNSWRGEK